MYAANRPAEFGIVPLGRQTISLRANRTRGERFPIAGQFFYAESVDLPCRLSFSAENESQSIGLSSGFQINAPFSEFYLYHDNYSNAGAANQPFVLNYYVSGIPRAFNQYINPAVQLPLPYRVNGYSGGSYTSDFPVFSRTRFLNFTGVLSNINLADTGVINCGFQFFDSDGQQILIPTSIVKDGINYNTSSGLFYQKFVQAIPIGSASAMWGYNFSFPLISLPTYAARGRFVYSFLNGYAGVVNETFNITVS